MCGNVTHSVRLFVADLNPSVLMQQSAACSLLSPLFNQPRFLQLSRRHEAMKKKLDSEYATLRERQQQFDKEKQEFENQQQRLNEERKSDK